MSRSAFFLACWILPFAGCRCLEGKSEPRQKVGDSVAAGDDVSSPRSAKVNIEELRKERPLDEWLSIHVKRNQLIGVRLAGARSSMCPAAPDAGAAAETSTSASIKELGLDLVRLSVGAAKQVWNDLAVTEVRAPPLHLAAFFCQPRAIAELVSRGASVASKDDRGMTALHWVTCAAAAEALLSAKADVNAAAEDGLTPLHLAINVPVAKVLVKAGARLDAKDRCGNRPLHTARYFGLSFSKRAPATGDAGDEPDLSSEPLWVRLLFRAVVGLASELENVRVLFDVYNTLLELGADPSAVNDAGRLPESIVQMGSGGGFDD